MSGLADAMVAAARQGAPTDLVTWGTVQGTTGDMVVRLAGDQSDVTVAIQNADVTFTVGDKVCLLRVGARWCPAFVFST